jgi:hypothetical protein
LPTFTFRQVGVKAIEFQPLPGPKARALHAKTMRHASFLGPGGQTVLSPGAGVFRCRSVRSIRLDCELGARAARPLLWKSGRISGQNSFPADAFCVQRPCFRATSLLFSKKDSQKSEGGTESALSVHFFSGLQLCREVMISEVWRRLTGRVSASRLTEDRGNLLSGEPWR